MNTLQRTWHEVKRDFFPRFDRGQKWRVYRGRFTTMSGEYGYCDDRTKRVYVAPHVISGGGDALRVVLIHELIHAVLGSSSHSARFIHRLRAAQEVAKRTGHHSLAAALEKEAAEYAPAHGERVSAAVVYSDLRDLVEEARPCSFKKAFRLLSNRYPLAYLRRLRRLKLVYEEAFEFRRLALGKKG